MMPLRLQRKIFVDFLLEIFVLALKRITLNRPFKFCLGVRRFRQQRTYCSNSRAAILGE